jgi:hypothetical protein
MEMNQIWSFSKDDHGKEDKLGSRKAKVEKESATTVRRSRGSKIRLEILFRPSKRLSEMR